MGPYLRFAGTLELAGIDFSINQRRVDAIRRGPPDHFEGMDDLELVEIWRGLRPCTPDGLPIVGASGKWENLILAAGHATIGMSLGPVTGEIVAQLACGETPEFDLEPLRRGGLSRAAFKVDSCSRRFVFLCFLDSDFDRGRRDFEERVDLENSDDTMDVRD